MKSRVYRERFETLRDGMHVRRLAQEGGHWVVPTWFPTYHDSFGDPIFD